jgi:O-antigen/teichoic acid export membrane protein
MSSEVHRQLGHLARGGSIGIVGAMVSALASFLLVVLITHTFDRATAGELFAASSLFIVLLSATCLGADVGLGRFVLRYVAAGRPDAVRVCVADAFRLVLVVSVVISAAIAIGSPLIARWMGLREHQGAEMLLIFAICLPASTLGVLALSASRAFGSVMPTVLIDRLGRSLLQPGLVLLVGVLGGGILLLTVAWVAPYVIAAVAACIILLRMLESRASKSLPKPDDSRAIRHDFWSFNWPRAIASVSQIAIQRADIIIIGAMISPSAAAVYTAATRFVVLGQFGTQAIQQVLQPQITHLLATDQMDVFKRVFKVSTAWNVGIAWPIYLAIGCAPPVYLSLFGGGFREQGVPTVVVMMFGMLIGIFSGPVDTVLLMAGRSTVSLVNSLVALVVDLGLCLILIPRLGITGAAIAWALAVAVRSLLGYLQVRRTMAVTPVSSASLVTAGASVACFGLPMLALSLTGHATVRWFIVAGVAGCVAYAFLLYLGRRTLHLRALRALFERKPLSMGESRF